MISRRTALSAGHQAKFAIQIALLTLSLILIGLPAQAQSTAGRVLGSVTDQSGASVAGATVVVTDTQRGTSRTLNTDASGDYVAPDLAPGTYKIHVEAKGFKSSERPSVTIEVATDVRADFSLQPGNVSETVTVSSEIPLLNTTSSTLGGTLSNQEINDLPLNGRNYENLLQLRPGVMRYPGGGFSTTSTDGLRAEDNAYFVEGLFNSEPFSGQGIINGAWRSPEIPRPSCQLTPSRNSMFRKNPRSGIRLEAGGCHQRRIEIRNQQAPRNRLCVRPRRRHGCAQLLQHCSCTEESPNPGTIWRQRRWSNHQGQSIFLRSL